MNTSRTKGFTLIELLVVIAVIGILSSVVLASLASAREKGKIASIKSNLKNLGSQAEIYYNDHNTYAGLCNPDNSSIDASIQPFIDEIKNIAGPTSVKCFVMAPEADGYFFDDAMENRNFAVVVAYKDNHYAVDNQGVVTFDTANTGGAAIWSDAQAACANVGKHLPSMEALMALWNIYRTVIPTGFDGTSYWSSSPSPTDSSRAVYAVYLTDGYAARNFVWGALYVRCVS